MKLETHVTLSFMTLSQFISYAIKPRIYVILRGGLGNQLHQIAAGVKLAEARNSRIIIFPHIVDTAINSDRRGLFRSVNIVGLFPNVKVQYTNKLENMLLRLANRNSFRMFKNFIVSDENFHQQEKYRFLILRGWFQSKDFLPSLINFKEIIREQKEDLHELVIHVRLTDFLTIDSNPLKLAYYNGAVQTLGKEGVPSSITCFSDDLQGAQEFLPNNLKYDFPELDKTLNSYELLVELASSKVLISSKSSLCWWAALCVVSSGGKVISPLDCPFPSDQWVQLNPLS